MLTLKHVVAFLSVAAVSIASHAAVTCVINSASGKFEGRGPGAEFVKSSLGNECDINKSHPDIREVQAAIKAPGTIIANGPLLAIPNDPVPLVSSQLKANASASKTETEQQDTAAIPLTQEWTVKRDDRTIRASLERWAKAAGWEIAWEVPRKVPASFEATFTGSFGSAVDKLMNALRGSDYPLVGCFYEDNRVVRILRRGEIKNCYD